MYSDPVILQHTGAQQAIQAASSMVSANDDSKLVLRVIVEQMMYPVTIEVLKQVIYSNLLKYSKNILSYHDSTISVQFAVYDERSVINSCDKQLYMIHNL